MSRPAKAAPGVRPLLWLLPALLAGLAGCPKPVPPPPFPTDGQCLESMTEVFGAQRFHTLALRPLAGETVFTPDLLAAVDRVTARLEAEQSARTLAIRSITTLPLMEPGPLGAKMTTMREELPADTPAAARLRALLFSYDFAVGDVIDPAGKVAFLQLPADNFVGVDLDAVVEALRPGEAEHLILALDGTPGADPDLYAEVAGAELAPPPRWGGGRGGGPGGGGGPPGPGAGGGAGAGPGATGGWVAFRGEEPGAVVTPEFLRALQGFAARTRALPAIAGAYSVVDDLRLTRRAVHKGDPGAAVLAAKQSEINQLIMLFELSGNAEDFGARLAADGQATVVRFGLAAGGPPDRDALLHRIQHYAGEGFPDGVTGTVCPE